MNITGGKYNSLSIQTADFANIKPTLSKIRQAVFNTINSMGEYETFCDLFAGSGIMSFEAVSRGYTATAIEIDKKSASFIKKNAQKLNTDFNLINYDSIKFLNKTDLQFDIFYLDPPYASDLYDKALKIIEEKNLLSKNGIIIIEKPSELKINLFNFSLVKEKKYSDKSILYLKNQI